MDKLPGSFCKMLTDAFSRLIYHPPRGYIHSCITTRCYKIKPEVHWTILYKGIEIIIWAIIPLIIIFFGFDIDRNVRGVAEDRAMRIFRSEILKRTGRSWWSSCFSGLWENNESREGRRGKRNRVHRPVLIAVTWFPCGSRRISVSRRGSEVSHCETKLTSISRSKKLVFNCNRSISGRYLHVYWPASCRLW